MSLAESHVYKTENSSLDRAQLSVTEPLTNDHFKNNRMVLKCRAYVYPIYANSDIMIFNITSDPKPERSKRNFIYSNIYSV